MKKILSLTMAAAMVASIASIPVFAKETSTSKEAVTTDLEVKTYKNQDGDIYYLTNDDGEVKIKDAKKTDSSITADTNPDKTLYLILGDTTFSSDTTHNTKPRIATAGALANKDLFKLKVDKDGDGKSLVKSVKQVADKKIGNDREQTIEIKLNDSMMTDELKAELDLTLTAKKDSTEVKEGDLNSRKDDNWLNDDAAKFKITLWINNEKVPGDDADKGEGDAFYFSATDNETNTITWGDDKAYLKFDANDDASDFYAKMSTKTNSAIYAEYGDPINADMWFYEFIGNPTIDSTSRGTLTLGIPWDDDDDNIPNPSDCFVYEIKDGELTDVTKFFTYGEDGDIEGWTTKTRTLGTYVVSDTELNLDAASADDAAETPTTGAEKVVPNTGR